MLHRDAIPAAFAGRIKLALTADVHADARRKNPIPQPDDILAVYIGAHPDDIDIGMSGSLYKYDAGRHPVLWIVATDGGAEYHEYVHEIAKGWVIPDGRKDYPWADPRGGSVTRKFFSYDLSQKRCGFNGPFTQTRLFRGPGYDWKQRVDLKVGPAVIKKIQMEYTDPSGTKHLYPDGSLSQRKELFTRSLAEGFARVIDTVITGHGYRRDTFSVHSHAPAAVASNAGEHPDHEITGNAVLEAIALLHRHYGYPHIDAAWYTIYTPVAARGDYTVTAENIADVKDKKSALCKAAWETDKMSRNTADLYWNRYPSDPGDFEYRIRVPYPQPG